MEVIPKKRLQLFAGRSNLALAEEVASLLDVELGHANIVDFANGEIHCRFGENVRGSDVFILQTHCRPVNDSIMEQLIMIDAAKRASAKRITAVCPFYGYARQDRKAEGREPITAKLLADMLTVAGTDRVVSVDLHSGQIQGFFDKPDDHLTAMPVLIEYLQDNFTSDLVVVSPDTGRTKVAERFSQHLGSDMAFVHKRHLKGVANAVEAREVVGDEARRDRLTALGLAVLSGVAVERAHGGDPLRRRPVRRVDHDQLLHDRVVDAVLVAAAVGLHDEHVAAADALGEPRADLTVGELHQVRIAELDTKVGRHLFRQSRMRAP